MLSSADGFPLPVNRMQSPHCFSFDQSCVSNVWGSDEPISGLDSQIAGSNLADSGQAILCTIHQPSAIIFQTFDQILLLGRGGKPVYSGEIGYGATFVKGHFERHGTSNAMGLDGIAKKTTLLNGY